MEFLTLVLGMSMVGAVLFMIVVLFVLGLHEPAAGAFCIVFFYLLIRCMYRVQKKSDARYIVRRRTEIALAELAERQAWEREWIPPHHWKYQEPIPRVYEPFPYPDGES